MPVAPPVHTPVSHGKKQQMIHERIKELRLKAGLSQAELASKLGVSRQAVTKWESGKGMPDIEHIRNLAALFGVSVDFLLAADAHTAPEAPVIKEAVDLRSLQPLRQPGKPFGSRQHAAIVKVFPHAHEIWALTRTKKNTAAQEGIEWFLAIVFDTPFEMFGLADSLSNRDGYYLVHDGNRHLLARVTPEFVEARELMEPPPAKKKFTIDRDVFLRAPRPLNVGC